jgi:acetyl-CoA C-acetyltransferase
MRPIYILGVGQTPVSKETDLSIRQLGAAAIRMAMADAGVERVDALYLGNMLSGMLSQQQHLGALVADAAGLRGVEAATAEAACSSGAAAVRWGVMAVASGLHDVVVVAGVEKMTHTDRYATTRALATASDWDSEGARGHNFVSLNAVLMQEYIERYRVNRSLFAPFAINAHRNALTNPNALFHKELDAMTYEQSKVVHDPVRLYDASPICNGSAAVVLAAGDAAGKATAGRPPVQVIASASATDSVGIADRRDRLVLDGVMFSSRRAYAQAGISPEDVDIFELHDAYTIMSVLALEAAGFARPGEGLWLGVSGEVGLHGRVPISTFGGLKARGHPVGATGVYQLAEVYLQLSGQAGSNQVPNARIAMAQNIGGTGATVLTHVLRRED